MRYIDPMENGTDSKRLGQWLCLDTDHVSSETNKRLQLLAADYSKLRQQVEALQTRLEHAESLADMDPLCPIFNRRAFLRELDREIGLATRHGHDLSVLYVDLDQFKLINDRFGHHIGDQVLVSFANLLRASIRTTDIVGRIGGDEFAVILVRSGDWQTSKRIQSLHEEISRQSGNLRGVKAALGAVSWQTGQTARATLTAADRAMYASKAGMRGNL